MTGHDVVEAAVAALTATGRFDEVARDEPDPLATAQWRAFAWVIGGDTPTDDLWDPIDLMERGVMEVWVAAQGEDPVARDADLESLTSAAKNALNGQSLAGYTLPGLTLARVARKAVVNHPIARRLISVEWTAIQGDGYAASDATSE